MKRATVSKLGNYVKTGQHVTISQPAAAASTPSPLNHQFAMRYTAALSISLVLAATAVTGAPPESSPSAAPADATAPADVTAPRRPENRLAKETSPYLLLHAHNPVDWFPWGPEALAKAQAEKKLIFLSVGYSSCYWCHVMERESFMDPEIAAFLNKHFVCIKVDREERPDIDEIYMTSLQVYFQLTNVNSAGGWPLSMFLTSDARPLAGGTYFPPRDIEGRTGFLTVLNKIHDFWAATPDQAATSSTQLADFVKQSLRQRPAIAADVLSAAQLDDLQAALAEEFDPVHGGFGYSEATARRPKFPEPANLMFLLDRVSRTQDAKAKEMLTFTLD